MRLESGSQRKAKGNQIRGLVAEHGLVAPNELGHLRAAIPVCLEDAENGLSARFRHPLDGLRQDLLALDQRMTERDRAITLIANADPAAKRSPQLRGDGP